jgi:predicted ATPase
LELLNLLAAAATRTQVIVTTHSDVLVSEMTEYADSILVCEHRGGTVLQRVEPGKLTYWLNKYRLGEVWRIGELGGNP